MSAAAPVKLAVAVSIVIFPIEVYTLQGIECRWQLRRRAEHESVALVR